MKDKIWLVITLLLFLTLGVCYSYYTPLWNPPDEERHFAYCEYIAQHHKLPPLKSDQEGIIIAQAIHPPLYYLMASLFCKNDGKLLAEEISVNNGPGFNNISHPKNESEFPYSGKARTAHLLRLFSLALSTATIYFIYLFVLTIFPGETTLALSTALFAGMNPQFLHISASISNENLSTLLSTIYLFALLRYLKRPPKTTYHIATGVLLGCCLLSKTSTVFFLPLTVCIIIWAYFRDKRKLIASLLLIFCMASLVAGWWYVRNWLVFGDPMLSKLLTLSQPWFVRRIPLSAIDLGTILAKTFTSFFGNFGALQILIPKIHLSIYGGIMLFSIAGLCRLLVARKLTASQSQAFNILLLSLLGVGVIFMFMNMKYLGVSMGRYLFVVIAPIALGVCIGVRSLFSPRLRNFVLIALSFLLIALNLDIFFKVLKPAYANTLLVKGIDQPRFCCSTAEVKGSTTISQTFISPKNNLCAIRVMFSSPNTLKSGEITFTLMEDGNKVLREIDFPLKKINDCTRHFFIFPPIKHSRGKAYMFRFSSPNLPTENGISLWHESSEVYSGGRMVVNGEPAIGDLYFTAYYFTGDYPKTIWQGKKEVVIKQGLYVTMRELQLYYERSKEYRGKTLTHEKLSIIKNAIHNRKLSKNIDTHA